MFLLFFGSFVDMLFWRFCCVAPAVVLGALFVWSSCYCSCSVVGVIVVVFCFYVLFCVCVCGRCVSFVLFSCVI